MVPAPSTAPASLEPIPGYRLKQLIGSGGYGEVWSAEAPGGLAKAIKLAHAHLDEKQAAVELQSLNRIKQVRHPFLLSLERIELIDQRLVIVSELADGSLKQRFVRSREAGLPGVPRDELLGYLKDAAEALDYIREYYSLQHLDVKPENLLLVGGRVKLADFGLVSEIDAAADGVVNGMTPLYASPEVFDGRPSPSSDQYSLAVLYCEMLTGVLPYDGKNTAQLAAQHLEGRPNLELLPAAERPLVQRALSKDPTQRFATCREFVDRLSWIATQAPVASPTPRTPQPGEPATSVPSTPSGWPPLEATPGLSGAQSTEAPAPELEMRTMAVSQVRLDWNPAPGASADEDEAAAIVDLPADAAPTGPAAVRPTLFIGLGGTGARALHALRSRLEERFGGVDRLPAIGMLVVDTSTADVCDALGPDQQAGFDSRQILLTPLRPAGSYTHCAVAKIRSVARRWLFNVPRSLKTEGFRPLGRLALVDNLDKFVIKVRGFLSEITSTEALAVTAAQVGQPAGSPAPRVFVIGSTSGGVGSGMLLEAAYTVRNVLTRLGVARPEVNGVLCFATSRQGATRDLGIANTVALLRELRHFSCPDQQFPGEPECGLPPAPRGQAPFDEAYFAHLGACPGEHVYQREFENIGEYLFRSALTESSQTLDHWRQTRRAGRVEQEPTLATFRVARRKPVEGEVITTVANWAGQALLQRWCGALAAKLTPSGALEAAKLELERQAQARETVADQFFRWGLAIETVLGKLQAALVTALAQDPDEYLRRALEQSLKIGPVCTALLPEILDTIDVIFGARDDLAEQVAPASLTGAMHQRAHAEHQRFLADLIDWALNLVDAAPGRLAETIRLIQAAQQRIHEMERAAQASLAAPLQEMKRCETALRELPEGQWIKRVNTRRGVAQLWIEPRLLHLFRLRLDEMLVRETLRLLAGLQSPLSALLAALRELQADLTRSADAYAPLAADADEDGESGRASGQEIVLKFLGRQPEEFLTQVELQLEHEFFGGPGPLKRLVTQAADRRRQLGTAIRQVAGAVARRACLQAGARDVSLSDALPDAERANRQRWHEVFTPQALAVGGARRVLIVKPHHDPEPILPGELSEHLSVPATIVSDNDPDTTICTEGENIQPARLAQMLTKHRREFNEVAARLASRVDVVWSELV